MEELTLILFIFAIGLFVVGMMLKTNTLNYLTFFVSICSIGCSLMDETMTEIEMTLLIIPTFYVMLMSGWYAFSKPN